MRRVEVWPSRSTQPRCADLLPLFDRFGAPSRPVTEGDMAATQLSRAAPMILIVDDDPDIRETLAEALELDGYRVSTAANGKIALEQARVTRPDLILLDLMMPVMSGWAFMEARRGYPGLASVPVVVITAAFDACADGATVFLRKPFELNTLLTIVARLCDGGRERLGRLSVTAPPG